jgi:hypothetical protein
MEGWENIHVVCKHDSKFCKSRRRIECSTVVNRIVDE